MLADRDPQHQGERRTEGRLQQASVRPGFNGSTRLLRGLGWSLDLTGSGVRSASPEPPTCSRLASPPPSRLSSPPSATQSGSGSPFEGSRARTDHGVASGPPQHLFDSHNSRVFGDSGAPSGPDRFGTDQPLPSPPAAVVRDRQAAALFDEARCREGATCQLAMDPPFFRAFPLFRLPPDDF